MYARYLKEREGLDVIETDKGFAAYKFRGRDCYIQDIYVLPEYRQTGVAADLADRVAALAKERGIRILTGSVDYRAVGAEASNNVLRAYGMHPYTTEGPLTYFCKEI